MSSYLVIQRHMKLYLVRHGESLGNAQNIHQPHHTGLSKLGNEQAELLAKRFQTIDIDLILSSHYARAHETAIHISKSIHQPIQIEESLHEIRRPTSMIGKSSDDPEVMKIKSLIAKNEDKDWHWEDGENIHELLRRAQNFLDSLDNRSVKNILAVSHGRFILAIICVALFGDRMDPLTYGQMSDTMMISNTGITVLVKRKQRWVLQTWNDSAHLGNI